MKPRTWPGWWASIANIDDVQSLPKRTADDLFAAYLTLCKTPLDPQVPDNYLPDFPDNVRTTAWATSASADALAAHFPPDRDETIRGAVELAQGVIRPMFSGSASGPVKAPFDGRAFCLTPDGYVLVTVSIAKGKRTGYEVALWHLLEPGRLFPIRRCPECGTFFERGGARKFCAAACQSKHRDRERSRTRERREVLKRAQQTFRDKAKRARGRRPSRPKVR